MNQSNKFETKNNIKSPFKDKIKVDDGIKKTSHHPTDP